MSKKNNIKNYLPDESLNMISQSISEIEKRTSGEIRVCLKKRKSLFEKNKTTREIALKEFFKMKMHETRDFTGVLLFIIFEEKKFEIIADKGIDAKITKEHWDDITEHMKVFFTENNYLQGIQFGLGKIGEVLINEFKIEKDDKNELPNEVIIR